MEGRCPDESRGAGTGLSGTPRLYAPRRESRPRPPVGAVPTALTPGASVVHRRRATVTNRVDSSTAGGIPVDTALTSADPRGGTVTSAFRIDSSRSCPQECAQSGDGRVPAGSRLVTSTRRPPGVTLRNRSGADPAADLGGRDATPRKALVSTGRAPSPPTGPGDRPWADGGRTVDGATTRCTAVEMSTCRQQEAADSPQRANSPIRPPTCAKGLVPQLPHR